MICSITTSFIFLFDKWAPNDPVIQSWLVKICTLFLLLLKNGPIYPVWFDRVNAQYVLLSGSLDIRCIGCQSQRRLLVVMLLINNTMLQIDGMCWAPNIWDESNNNSEIQYSIIGRIHFVRFQMSRSLSFGLSPDELPCIYFDWFLVQGISLPAAQLPLRVSSQGVWAI